MIASAIYWLKYDLVLEYLLFIALTNVTNISSLNIFQCCLVACSACFAWAEVSAHWLCHLRTIVLLVEKVLGWLLDSPRSSCRVNCCWCPGCPRTFGAFQVIFWDFTGLQNAPVVNLWILSFNLINCGVNISASPRGRPSQRVPACGVTPSSFLLLCGGMDGTS